MNRAFFSFLLLILLSTLSSCAQLSEDLGISERTGVAAATGGAIGAGLGAIVGHQTGDLGAGIALGAVAGATAGTMVGEAFTAQDAALEQQDEILARQKEILTAQRKHIDQYKGSLREKSFEAPYKPANSPLPGGSTSYRTISPVKETHSAVAKSQPQKVETQNTPPAALKESVPMTPECEEAFDYYGKGLESSESADKFFYLRKSLTLCPQEARFHAAMGEAYEQSNRIEDAEFEYREALKLNPMMTGIKQRLDNLRRGKASDLEAF